MYEEPLMKEMFLNERREGEEFGRSGRAAGRQIRRQEAAQTR